MICKPPGLPDLLEDMYAQGSDLDDKMRNRAVLSFRRRPALLNKGNAYGCQQPTVHNGGTALVCSDRTTPRTWRSEAVGAVESAYAPMHTKFVPFVILETEPTGVHLAWQ
jgi:hypothetical protein